MNMLSGKHFCVTGATGRLGTAAVERLEALGADVTPLVFGRYPDKPKRIEWKAETDPKRIQHPEKLDGLKVPDYVIHFHWEVDRTLPYVDQFAFEVNRNIYDLHYFWQWLQDAGIKRFINISTIKIFSHLNENPISAATEPRPFSPYGIAKLAGEKFYDSYFYRAAFPVVHLRLSTVASFGEHPSHLLSRLYAGAFKGERITVNKGHKVFMFYIDEIIDLIINAAVNAKSNKYLLVKEGYPVEEIARTFEAISGKIIQADYQDLAPGQKDPVFKADYKELEADWVRRVDLEAAVSKIIELNSMGDSS